nr:serine protease SPPA, chloroplastic [Tanacetum cinerariifolium]
IRDTLLLAVALETLEIDWKYSEVKETLGLSSGKDKLAVIRASGNINRVKGSMFSPISGIIAETVIEKIRNVRDSKKYKAVIIRIDIPGVDALSSDLLLFMCMMWKEIKLLAEYKHVVKTESIRMDLNSEKEKSKQMEKDHLEFKENHLKLQKKHVSLTKKVKKVNFLLKHFTAWQSQENALGSDTNVQNLLLREKVPANSSSQDANS